MERSLLRYGLKRTTKLMPHSFHLTNTFSLVRKMQVHLYVNNISYKIKAIFSRSFCQLLLDRL